MVDANMNPPSEDGVPEVTVNNDADAGHSGVGALLRASRERLGEDLSDVARMLRIRLPYMEAIETGKHDVLPGSTYAVGFVRAYSNYLGLDSEEVVRRFKAENADGGTKQDLSFPTPEPETGMPGGAIVFVGLVLVGIAYGAWFLSTQANDYIADLVSPIPERFSRFFDGDDKKNGAPKVTLDAIEKSIEEPKTTIPDADPATVQEAPSATTSTPATELAPKVAEPARIAPASGPKAPQPEPVQPELAQPGSTQSEPVQPDLIPPQSQSSTDQIGARAPSSQPSALAAGALRRSVDQPLETPALEAKIEKVVTPAAIETDKVVADVNNEVSPPPVLSVSPETTVAAPKKLALSPPSSLLSAPSPEPIASGAADVGPAAKIEKILKPIVEPTPQPTPQPSRQPKPIAVSKPEILTAPTVPPEPQAPSVAQALSEPDVAAVSKLKSKPIAVLPTDSEIKAVGENAPPTPEVTPSIASRIVIGAVGDSWIQIRDKVSKEMLMTRLLQAGDSYDVPDRPGLVLLTGNAGALRIVVDGKEAPSIGGSGVVLRNVALDPDRLSSGTAIDR